MQNLYPPYRITITLLALSLLAVNGLFAQRENNTRYVGIERNNPDAAVIPDPNDWLADDLEVLCLLKINQIVTLTGDTDGSWVKIRVECNGETVEGWVKKAILTEDRIEIDDSIGSSDGQSTTAVGAVKANISSETPKLSGVANSIPYPWNRINMTDYRMKPGVAWIKVPPPKGGVPIWIPIGGGVIVTGGVVYLLTSAANSGPKPTALRVQDDQLTVPCGQELTFNPLLNDQGTDLQITHVTSSSSVQIDWRAEGQISLRGLPASGHVTLTITVVDSQGQTAEESATIQILNTPLSATEDSFTTVFQLPVSENITTNDQGTDYTITDFTQPNGGELDLSPSGAFTFSPLPDFSGMTTFTYTLTDACGQTATATVSITVEEPDCSFSVDIETTPTDCGVPNGTAAATLSAPGDYRFSWSSGSTLPTATGLPPGDISVTVTAAGERCEATATINELAPNYVLSSRVLPGNCLGEGADILLDLSSPAGALFTVATGTGQAEGIPSENISLSTYFELRPGSYDLTIYDSTIGPSCSQTLRVVIPDNSPSPEALPDQYSTPFQTPVSNNVLTNDQGLGLVLTGTTDLVGGSLDFSPDGSFTFVPDPDFVGEASFRYTVTDACENSTDTRVQIEVLPPDCTFQITVRGRDANCGVADGQAEASVDEAGDYQYSWSDGQVGPVISNLRPDDYAVTATELTTGCSATASLTIGEVNDPYITDLMVIEGSCGDAGDIILSLTTNVSPELRVTVVFPGGEVIFVTEPGSIALSDYMPMVVGNYTITVEDPAQGPACAETTRVTLRESPPGPGIRLLEAIPPSSPSAADGALTILIEPFTVPPFSILLNGELWGSTEAEVFTIGGLAGGSYTVQLIDALGCASNELETFLPFGDGMLRGDIIGGAPILPPFSSSSRVEHPKPDLPLLSFAVGTQLRLSKGRQRYQLALWQLGGLGVSGQSLQLTTQRGWQGEQWAFFNGLSLAYQRLRTPDQRTEMNTPFAYWSTELAWQPKVGAPWGISMQSALGRRQAWWWQGTLQVQVQW